MRSRPEALEDMSRFRQLVTERIPPGDPTLYVAWSTYANEAIWGRRYLHDELCSLRDGATILEVGAGTLALSGQLAREDFSVTALEPVSTGFDVIESLSRLVANALHDDGVSFDHLPIRAEELAVRDAYDFAFSINVLEHVDDVEGVLDRVVEALRPGGRFRFRCPNYDFPYEPHFGWIVPPRKAWADPLCRPRVASSPTADAQGLWDSLNWVTLRQIRSWASRRGDVRILFNPDALHEIWLRAKSDSTLLERHSGPLTSAVSLADRVGAARLLRSVPTAVQPVIDGLMIKAR